MITLYQTEELKKRAAAWVDAELRSERAANDDLDPNLRNQLIFNAIQARNAFVEFTQSLCELPCIKCQDGGLVELTSEEQKIELEDAKGWREPATMKPCPECRPYTNMLWTASNAGIKA